MGCKSVSRLDNRDWKFYIDIRLVNNGEGNDDGIRFGIGRVWT